VVQVGDGLVGNEQAVYSLVPGMNNSSSRKVLADMWVEDIGLELTHKQLTTKTLLHH
jgi:hypothetical protein